jgi:3-oxoacyl-[acyl-carrier-protein] synthase III
MQPFASIAAIEYHLPERTLTNDELAAMFPEWPPERIKSKLGISTRHLAGPDECASDLAVKAAERLFRAGACSPDMIDFVLLCTQSPDYILPTTACVLQSRLGIPTHAGALDFNLGCSGYVYGVSLAKGLIETGQAQRVLLLTADTYSRYLDPADKSVRTVFGDGAAATLICAATSTSSPSLGPFVFGTDGRGAPNLMVHGGGTRRADGNSEAPSAPPARAPHLYMNGAEIMTFTLRAVPQAVSSLLTRANLQMSDVDFFVFHQANRFVLDKLRQKMAIPESKFVVSLEHCGNTVSSSIPIALKDALVGGTIRSGQVGVLVGFGVGYSWAAGLATCP